MPWQEVSIMDQRQEFVMLALQEGANRRALCRQFGISPQTGYKWLARRQAGDWPLADRPRRPRSSPARISAAEEQRILRVRDEHPAWGARKIRHCLDQSETPAPASSTVHRVLERNDRIVTPAGGAAVYERFEMPAANQLWQMDFKGWHRLDDGMRCQPLTVLDDHSRFLVCLQACADQQLETVQARLEPVFRRYGLPAAFYVDNGSPWGGGPQERWTKFGVWLLKLGVWLTHSRPYRPQGRGKNERLHRTLKAEVLSLRTLRDLAQAQSAFDAWRTVYNLERPHQALGYAVPASRYQPSLRAMPDRLMQPEYAPGEIVRRVSTTQGYVKFKGRLWPVGQAFSGEWLAIRPRGSDGQFGIYFGAFRVGGIDLTNPQGVHHVSEQVSTMSRD